MSLWTAVILGIVEGLTEFIPVSSTGHLILAGQLLQFHGPVAKTFDVVIQLGAILAVVWLYRLRFKALMPLAGWRKFTRTSQGLKGLRGCLLLGLTTLPALLVGKFAYGSIKAYLFNPLTVAGALIAGGVAILLIEKMAHRAHVKEVDGITLKQALGVGIAQCLALFPGVSRSGATIMGGLMIGFDRKVAVEFSFFLAIPTMFAATGYDLLKNLHSLSAADLPLFLVGFITAFFSALIVIKAFLGYVSKHDFSGFAYYRIVFGLLVLAAYRPKGWIF
jgi:undecaprenyl-diphosphatase